MDRSIGADLMKTELMVPECDRVEKSFVTGDAFERFLLVIPKRSRGSMITAKPATFRRDARFSPFGQPMSLS